MRRNPQPILPPPPTPSLHPRSPPPKVLYDRIIGGDFDFSPAPNLSPTARDLICGLLHMPPDERLTARAVLSHKWLRATAPSPPATLGLLGAVLDPACRQLMRRMETEFGMDKGEVLAALRRGERGPSTAVYWLLRQRELKQGTIQRWDCLCSQTQTRGHSAAAPNPLHISLPATVVPLPPLPTPHVLTSAHEQPSPRISLLPLPTPLTPHTPSPYTHAPLLSFPSTASPPTPPHLSALTHPPRYVALKPKPPPPRQGAAAARRRPVPAHIRAAAGRLPPPPSQLPYLPIAALSLNAPPPPPPAVPLTARVGSSDVRAARPVVRTEELARHQREEARTYVHSSGALTERAGHAGVSIQPGWRGQPLRAPPAGHISGGATPRRGGGASAELFQIAQRPVPARRAASGVEAALGPSGLGVHGRRYHT